MQHLLCVSAAIVVVHITSLLRAQEPSSASGIAPLVSGPIIKTKSDFPETSVREQMLQQLHPVFQQLQTASDSISVSYTAQQGGFDPAVVSQGQAAFQEACTQCHDANRALDKRKSLSGWRATVRRMARMDGADISSSEMRSIATYLASLSQPASMEGDESAAESQDGGTEMEEILGSGLSVSGTFSTLWRGGNNNLENSDFFADAWLRADWQPDGPLSARATACTSCHSDATGDSGFTLELVEAAAHYDLLYWLREHKGHTSSHASELEIGIKAGRFVVPFGAFAAMSHPGIYRTVTNPLMYNMGRNVGVNPGLSRPPVIPMPYADEGVDLQARIPLIHDITASLDAYAVNGLVGFGPGVQFTPSRSYADNNSEPAAGGRVTIGNRDLRVGGSVMSGTMNDDGFPQLNYHLTGADVTIRCEEILRFYFEYAIRRNDSDLNLGQIVYGTVYELEILLWSQPSVSVLARYDNLEYRDDAGESSIERFTWGLNTTLPGGSMLILNHERWNFPAPDPDTDIAGFRWVATF